MIFTSELMTLAWKIKREMNISWGAALRFAIKVAPVAEAAEASTSVFGTWTPQAHRAVAGHFWGLHKAYNEIGDAGRSIAMCKVSKTLFAMYEEMVSVDFRSLIRQRGIRESVATEIVDFFVASSVQVPTARTLDLIANQGAVDYGQRLILPTWTF
jgi:hypothetical protein